jgi:hypothetical protein
MGAWKQFLASDVIVAPFLVNKGFSFTTSSFYTESNGEYVGIERFFGENTPWNVNYNANITTGVNQIEYEYLIYNSVKQLYYSNYQFSTTGDPANLKVLVPGAGPSGSGDVFVSSGVSGSGPLYDNFLQSTLTPTRFLPTGSGNQIGVISIPSKIFGEYIAPSSLIIQSGSFILIDDGEGNVIVSGSNVNYGNVIYTHGIIVLTNSASYAAGGGGEGGFLYASGIYSTASYGATFLPGISELITGSITCSFSSSMTIYETQYKCTIQPSEFNATLNPSAQASGSTFAWTGSYFYQPGNGQLLDSLTGSYFSPYVTAVGLYDEAQNLIAVGKLSQPLPTSPTTDTTILVNLDL